jgi:uncharacterized protein (DUF2062 family)
LNAPGPSSAGKSRPAGWVRRQLTQGISPERLALTVAAGTACSLFPFLGFTSLLNLLVGLGLRLNQPVLQGLNQLLGPLQLFLILPYIRLGEWIWRSPSDRFALSEMIQCFRDGSILEFLARFGWAGAHALTAWAVTAPPIVLAVYWLLRPWFGRIASPGATPLPLPS